MREPADRPRWLRAFTTTAVAASILAWATCAMGAAAPQSQPAKPKERLKLRTSEWIAKWRKENAPDKIIRRVERLLRNGPATKIASVSAGVERLTGNGLIATLIDARIASAATSGKLTKPTLHELALYYQRTHAAALSADRISRSILATIKADLRKAAYRGVTGEERAQTRKRVADLLTQQHASLVRASRSAVQARAIYEALMAHYGRSADTKSREVALKPYLKRAVEHEADFNKLTLKKANDPALDEIIAAYGRLTVEEAKLPPPKKPEPRPVKKTRGDDSDMLTGDEDGKRKKRRGRRRRRDDERL